jgi:hypothetical protein
MRPLLAIPLLVLATACGSSGAVDLGPASDPAGTVSTGTTSSSSGTVSAPPATSAPAPAGVPLEVWFERDGKLWPAQRRASGKAVIHDAVTALLAGPTAAEAGQGITSEVPAGTQLLGISMRERIVTVDLTSEFVTGGDAASERARLAQLVYTVTQFAGIGGMHLRVNGVQQAVFPGDGLVIPPFLTPQSMDFTSLVPPIIVTSPLPGQTVSPPFTIRGVADVFEAALNYRILDAAGREIVSGSSSASCGTGCVGGFSFEVPDLAVAQAQAGTLVVFDSDPSGIPSKTVSVRVPIRLSPLYDVTAPLPRAAVTSPVTVRFATAYTAQILVRVMDARFHELGRRIVQPPISGSCCTTRIAFSATGATQGYIVVSPLGAPGSAEEIPVTLNGG